MNKDVKIQLNNVVIDGVVTNTVGAQPINPKVGDVYSVQIANNDYIPARLIPNGTFRAQYYIWNGVGYAAITGKGEQVTFHE